MTAMKHLSNFTIPVYRECFYGEPLLGVLTGDTSKNTSLPNINHLDKALSIAYTFIVSKDVRK